MVPEPRENTTTCPCGPNTSPQQPPTAAPPEPPRSTCTRKHPTAPTASTRTCSPARCSPSAPRFPTPRSASPPGHGCFPASTNASRPSARGTSFPTTPRSTGTKPVRTASPSSCASAASASKPASSPAPTQPNGSNARRCARKCNASSPKSPTPPPAAHPPPLTHSCGGLGATPAPVLLHGESAGAWPVLKIAVQRGLDTRIGLEDTLQLPDGTIASDNAELVTAAERLRLSA